MDKTLELLIRVRTARTKTAALMNKVNVAHKTGDGLQSSVTEMIEEVKNELKLLKQFDKHLENVLDEEEARQAKQNGSGVQVGSNM